MKAGRTYGGMTAEDRAAGRRERLLEAGLELFGTRGYLDTGVKDICAEAGLTDRYFYESFADKQRLFIEIFDQVTSGLFELVGHAVVSAGSEPEAQLRAAIGAFVEALADDNRKARLVFGEAPAAGPEAERHMRTTLRQFSALVAETARQHLPADVSESLLIVFSHSVVGTIDRVVAEWQEGELDLPVEEITESCVALFATILAGIGE
ncbi:MAG TPA: TetR/AcrR family transcriptional regulator [Solirubrobacterales bacterium]|nr:TetR/AcrR family transcriptional regulator [Solirubrobacterales bacterium]